MGKYRMVNCCLPQCGGHCSRDFLQGKSVSPDGKCGGKLLFILLTFLSAAREKLQKSAAKDRTYGSSLDSNSLVTLAVPR